MAYPGEIVKLEIATSEHGGYHLANGEEMIFLPFEDIKGIVKVGDKIEVFLFHNERNEVEATTKLPRVSIGTFNGFIPQAVTKVGAFFDIGTKRDILVPARESNEPIEMGRPYLLTLIYDERKDKIAGTTRIHSYLTRENMNFERGSSVEIIIQEMVPAGWKVIVAGKHPGLLLRQETHQRFRIGDKTMALVKAVEDHGVLVSMQKEGIDKLLDAKQQVMTFLENNGGYARLSDNTEPEEIKLRLKMSKKTFKSAIGMLSKEGKIGITKRGIKISK